MKEDYISKMMLRIALNSNYGISVKNKGGYKMKNVRIDTRKNLVKEINKSYAEHTINGYTKITFNGGYHLLTVFGEKAIFQDFNNDGKLLAETIMPLSDILKII